MHISGISNIFTMLFVYISLKGLFKYIFNSFLRHVKQISQWEWSMLSQICFTESSFRIRRIIRFCFSFCTTSPWIFNEVYSKHNRVRDIFLTYCCIISLFYSKVHISSFFYLLSFNHFILHLSDLYNRWFRFCLFLLQKNGWSEKNDCLR